MKCDFCPDMARAGTLPYCVQACPQRAIYYGDLEEDIATNGEELVSVSRFLAENHAERQKQELGTRPRVYYKHLYLMKGCFVGGTAVTEKDGIEDCVAGAEVVLTQQGRQVAQTRTDIFGEFKIDQLEPRSGSYELQVSDGTAPGVSMTFELGEKSLYLGKMRLHSGS